MSLPETTKKCNLTLALNFLCHLQSKLKDNIQTLLVVGEQADFFGAEEVELEEIKIQIMFQEMLASLDTFMNHYRDGIKV